MMGRREEGQGQFFYSFELDKVVPPDHLVRQIDGLLDLSWVHKELAPYYSHTGRPSIDPVLMIRMLIVGYAFAIRSERRLCSEVRVNLAYRWFCKLGIEDKIPDHWCSRVRAMSAFARAMRCVGCLRVWLRCASCPDWWAAKHFRSMRASSRPMQAGRSEYPATSRSPGRGPRRHLVQFASTWRLSMLPAAMGRVVAETMAG